MREKQGKGKKRKNAVADPDAASPDPSGSADKTAGGTTRKCANCGQVGHIKTNKRFVHRCDPQTFNDLFPSTSDAWGLSHTGAYVCDK